MQKSKSQFNHSTTLRAGIKNYPNWDEEKKCWKRGYKFVVGLDEAGRGPLAGPVVAGAVAYSCHPGLPPASPCEAWRAGDPGSRPIKLDFGFRRNDKFGTGKTKKALRDSKKLSVRQREEWYKILTTCPDIKWGIGIVSEKIIDKINIFEATKLAMKKAVSDLKRKCYIFSDRQIGNTGEAERVDFIILDGNFTLEDLSINQKAIVRGDEKVFSCAAASIIAKVTRDRIMSRYAKKYPQYGFEKHKGYGTLAHRRALEKHGLCPIHRRSFKFHKI